MQKSKAKLEAEEEENKSTGRQFTMGTLLLKPQNHKTFFFWQKTHFETKKVLLHNI